MSRVPDQTNPVLSLPLNSHFPRYGPLLPAPCPAAAAAATGARPTVAMVRRTPIILAVDMTGMISKARVKRWRRDGHRESL